MYQCNSPPAPELLKAQSLDELATSWFFRLVLPAWLPHSQSTSNCQRRCTPFSPAAISWRGCSQSALLHSVNSVAALPALCQLSCILSAQLQSICCHSSAVTDQLQDISSAMKCKILCNLSSQLQSVFSVMICQLGSSLSAQSVSSAATGVAQLRCVSAQLRCCQKAQLQLVNSAVRSAATCQLSCTLLAQVTLIISAAIC